MPKKAAKRMLIALALGGTAMAWSQDAVGAPEKYSWMADNNGYCAVADSSNGRGSGIFWSTENLAYSLIFFGDGIDDNPAVGQNKSISVTVFGYKAEKGKSPDVVANVRKIPNINHIVISVPYQYFSRDNKVYIRVGNRLVERYMYINDLRRLITDCVHKLYH